MYNLSELQLWREHRDDLLREAERRRLISELRTAQGKGFRLRDLIRTRRRKRLSSLPTGRFRKEDENLASLSHE